MTTARAAAARAVRTPAQKRPLLHLDRGSLGFAAVAFVVFGIAAGIVFRNLAIGHALYGLTEYDDGVYFGAAMHLVHGQLPYRSFVLVQPPGITLLLAPVALVVGPGDPRLGLAIARVLTGAVVGLDALLIAVILRHRGLLAALVGGTLFAIYPTAYSSDHTLMIEPFVAFFCLLAIALAFRNGKLASDRRLLFAGVALGFAGAVKVIAISVAITFLVVLAWRHRRALAIVAVGAVVGFVLPCLPFFVAAPHAFIHDVVASQFNRSTQVPAPLAFRIASLIGLVNLATQQVFPLRGSTPWPYVGGIILATISILGTLWTAVRRLATTLTWFCVVGAFVAFGLIVVPKQFYAHYAYLSAALFALVLGGVTGTVADAARAAVRRIGRRAATLTAGWVAAAVFLAASGWVVAFASDYQVSRTSIFGDPGASLDRSIPAGACVVSDATSELVIANRMNFSPDCPVIVDSTGTWLTYDPNNGPTRARTGPMDPKLVALWKQIFSHVDYAVFAGNNAFRVPFTPALIQWFNNNFAVVPGAAPITFVKRPHPITHAPPVPNAVP